VSIPGVDVLSAVPGQLIFNSDWSAFSRYRVDTYTFTWSPFSGRRNVASHSGRYNFGKTFASPPMVWFYKVASGGYHTPIGNSGGFNLNLSNSYTEGPATHTRIYQANASVDDSGIDFVGWYDKRTDGWPVPNLSLLFHVFEYNL